MPASAQVEYPQHPHSDMPSQNISKRRTHSVSPPSTPHNEVRRPKNYCFMYPEQTMQAELVDAQGRPVVVTGRADWCFGYGTDETFLLVAIEAKQEVD